MATLKICGYVDGACICYFEGPLEMGTILGEAVTSTLESISMQDEVIQSYFFIPLGRRPIEAKPESKTIANAVYTVYLADAGVSSEDNADDIGQRLNGPSSGNESATSPEPIESPSLAVSPPSDSTNAYRSDLPETLKQHKLFDILRKHSKPKDKAVCNDTIQKLTKNRPFALENLYFTVSAIKKVIVSDEKFDPYEGGVDAWPNKQTRKAYFFHLAKNYPCLLAHIGDIVGHPRKAKLCKAISNHRASVQRYVRQGSSGSRNSKKSKRANSSDVSEPKKVTQNSAPAVKSELESEVMTALDRETL